MVLWRLLNRKPAETGKVGVHHPINMGHSGVWLLLRSALPMSRDRPVVPTVTLAVPCCRDGRCRHCVLMHSPRCNSRLGSSIGWRRLVLEPNNWGVKSDLLGLCLHCLVCLRSPRPSAIPRWSAVVDIETVETTLQAGVVHVEISSLVLHGRLDKMRLVSTSWVSIGIDNHGRWRPSSRTSGSRRNRVKRLDTWKTE